MLTEEQKAEAARRREALVEKKVFIRLTGVYGRVLEVVANPRSGYDELRVMTDKDGTIGIGLWPLGMVREVPETEGPPLCWEREQVTG